MIHVRNASPLESDASHSSTESLTVSEASTMSQDSSSINLDELDVDALLAAAKDTLSRKPATSIYPEKDITPKNDSNSTLNEIKGTISHIPKLTDTEAMFESLDNTKKSSMNTKPVKGSIIASKNGSFRTPNYPVNSHASTLSSDDLVFRKITDPVLVKKEKKASRENTTGDKWFNMPKAEMTPDLKRDLQLIQMRSVLDPKRHYKKNTFGTNPNDENGGLPTFVQRGTIVEDSTEFFSARINRKQRKKTIADELLSDDKTRQYFKRKYDEIMAQKNKVRKDRRRKY